MALLVSDSSVLIDLERGGLLEAAFASGLTLVVPDFLYVAELEESNGAYLQKLGLTVTALTSDEMALAQEILSIRGALSLPDCAALVCALRPKHLLLSGDGPLRAEAAARKVTCSGLLWFLDQMLATKRVSHSVLHEALSRVSQDPRCRLPKTEVEKRLRFWANVKSGPQR